MKKLGLKKSVARKGKYRLQGSRPFGIIDKVTSTNQMRNTGVNYPVRPNYEARKLALASVLKAEYWKAQAIALTHQIAYV